MFEGRMFFVDSLIIMGASIIWHTTPTGLSSPDRVNSTAHDSAPTFGPVALLMASLCARGLSTIFNIRQIDPGYSNIDKKLRALGASIERHQIRDKSVVERTDPPTRFKKIVVKLGSALLVGLSSADRSEPDSRHRCTNFCVAKARLLSFWSLLEPCTGFECPGLYTPPQHR